MKENQTTNVSRHRLYFRYWRTAQSSHLHPSHTSKTDLTNNDTRQTPHRIGIDIENAALKMNCLLSRNERVSRQPAAPNYGIKIIILFPFLFIIRIIILCGVIIGEMFRSDKRSGLNDTQASIAKRQGPSRNNPSLHTSLHFSLIHETADSIKQTIAYCSPKKYVHTTCYFVMHLYFYLKKKVTSSNWKKEKLDLLIKNKIKKTTNNKTWHSIIRVLDYV